MHAKYAIWGNEKSLTDTVILNVFFSFFFRILGINMGKRANCTLYGETEQHYQILLFYVFFIFLVSKTPKCMHMGKLNDIEKKTSSDCFSAC